MGVDELHVRRELAPPLRPYGVGSLRLARAALLTTATRAEGRRLLERDVHAPTTRRTRSARERTLADLAGTAGFRFVPVTVDKLDVVAGALKAGGLSVGRQLPRAAETAGTASRTEVDGEFGAAED